MYDKGEGSYGKLWVGAAGRKVHYLHTTRIGDTLGLCLLRLGSLWQPRQGLLQTALVPPVSGKEKVGEVVVAQDDDMEEEEDEAEDSCGDGFVVPNGYISDDEGVASVQQDLDDLAAELDGAL